MSRRYEASTTRECSSSTRRRARIVRYNVPLDDGRIVSLFVNRDTRLVNLDIVDADERGGVEVYRKVV